MDPKAPGPPVVIWDSPPTDASHDLVMATHGREEHLWLALEAAIDELLSPLMDRKM